MDDDRQDLLFRALGHRTRRRILDVLRASPGCTVHHVASRFDVSRIAVMKHLRTLEDAGLVVSRKVGRARALHFNPVPIQEIHEQWTDDFGAAWAAKLTRIKRNVEAGAEATARTAEDAATGGRGDER